ncbi:hypothetical protein O1O06_10715 [Grimontia hollisae]|uniref:hypothetical protein n=1 Tax=Grimontia hollisae TaxID=673 RepID=UPI001E530A09|nr:hypothetical protein [Grimontia hollisae]MDF2185244.1 hypothetical protein [Grimontia hollisae]
MESIVYVGPKDVKRDTVTGSRLVFPRLKPMEVTDEQAARLLRFEQVFVPQTALKAFLEAEKAKEQAEAEAKAKANAEAKSRQEAMDMTVTILGELVDVSKMSGPKLATWVESIDGLEADPKGPQETMPDYRKRVRDAVRAMGDG